MSQALNIAIIDRSAPFFVDRLKDIVPPTVRLIDGSVETNVHPDELDAVITQNWTPQAARAPRLRWLHLLSAGYDHVPMEVRQSSQWVVTHGGGASVVPMAEWCLTMMLHFAHRVPKILDYQARRSWHKNRMTDIPGRVLRGETIGIIGYGALGRELARMCSAMGMNVMASLGRRGKQQSPTYRTPGTGDPEGTFPHEWFSMNELGDALERMDYVVLGLRSTESTRHLINADALARFKPSAVLINPSRGALVDEMALIDALRAGKIGGAALDVYETEPLPASHPLREAPNIVLSPHCSPESTFYRQEMCNLIGENIRRFAEGQSLLNVVLE